MGHSVLSQHGKVHRGEKLVVSHLDSVLGVAGKCAKELIQPAREALRPDAARLGDGLELEDERPGVLGEMALVGLVYLFDKEIRIEEVRIDLSGLLPVLSLGEGMNG